MQCLVEGSVILKNQTLLTALTYCASDIGCAKVYDFECDGRGTFLLCKRWNNEFFNDHLDGVEKWAIFRKVSRTKFLNTLEQNQLLASSCLYSKHSENNNCDPSIHNCDCPWEYQTTKQDDVLLCNDGYSCNGQTHPEGYGCCNRHLGRALCMRNSPFMCNHTGCGASKEFPDGDFCCEKKENCNAMRPCDSKGTIQPIVKYRCPWKHESTPIKNLCKCSDGHFCNALTHPLGYACCKSHGGFSVCPSNYPVMCDNPTCANGTDYSCEGSKYDCEKTCGGTERPCETITQGNKG